MANNIVKSDGIGRLATTVYASAARTVTPDTQEFEIGAGWQSLTLIIDTTAASSPSTVFKTEWVDRVSGKVFSAYPSAAVTGTGTITLTINPQLTASGTTIYRDVVQPVVRVTATHGNANSHTYSVGLLLG